MDSEHLKSANNSKFVIDLVSLLPRFGKKPFRIIFYKPSWFVKSTMEKDSQYLFRHLS